jgi:hemoglobin-like flavoprotein
VDERRLKESFARAAAHGDDVALFFYSHLFLGHPEVRDLFSVSMSGQRDKLLQALGRIVADVSGPGDLEPYLRGLGRDHRKFGALAAYYPVFGASLLATVAHFNGTDWTVISAVSEEPDFPGEGGTVADVVGRRVPLAVRDAYVCGSSAMVTATVNRLRSLGMTQDHIYVEDFGWSE